MESTIENVIWISGKKILFRFFFLFFLLFIITENNGAYPFWGIIFHYPQEWLHHFIPWVGKSIVHLSYDITVFTNGSGDTTYDWLIVLVSFVISLIGTIIWSLLDRNRDNYSMLFYWLTVAIRYYVALMLIQYGLIKIIKLQFPFPGSLRLAETYGDSSPMGLAWTFLGFSAGYNLFMGIAEVAACLLLFRRTMTLGTIITLMTTSNVMAVNFFYDVPVKIVSSVLVMMTLFLLAHNAEEILKFFFTNQRIALTVITGPSLTKKIRLTGMVFKSLLIINSLGIGTYQALQMKKTYTPKKVLEPPLYGNYLVESFVKGGVPITLLTTDSARWRELKIETEHYGSIKMIYDSILNFSINADTSKNILYMTQTDGNNIFAFKFAKPDSTHLILKGALKSDSLKILLKKQRSKKYQLMTRGFHWISEYPYNR